MGFFHLFDKKKTNVFTYKFVVVRKESGIFIFFFQVYLCTFLN